MPMPPTRVKICGLTTLDDALEAVDAGADAVGLVFAEGSPRQISIGQAAAMVEVLPAFVTVVGLFMNHSAEVVTEILDAVPLDVLQFHGFEAPDYCESFKRRFIKTVPLGGMLEALDYAMPYGTASAFLLDSHALGERGGTGTALDLDFVLDAIDTQPEDESRPNTLSGRPLILAGGLKPNNVAAAVQRLRPHGVDVSSGVESAPGRKDRVLMRQFVDEVRRACRY